MQLNFRDWFRYVVIVDIGLDMWSENAEICLNMHISRRCLDMYSMKRIVWICGYFRVMFRYVHILTNLSVNSHIEYHNMIFSLSHWSNFMIDIYFSQRFVWICSYFRVMFKKNYKTRILHITNVCKKYISIIKFG